MTPNTREEKFLNAILTGNKADLPKPITREEQYLKAIAEKPSGGGGGTSDYNDLENKPSINGETLQGSKSLGDLGIQKTLIPGENIEINEDGEISATGGSSELASDMEASVTVGGVSAGTEFEEGTSLETVIRNILSPTLYPSFTAPSASMTATGAKLLETGATLNTTFTITFNRGAITPAYGTSGYRSGVASEYTLDGTTQSSNTFSKTITSAKTSYQGSVSYEAGEQPKDSNGGNYGSPLPAGSVNTNTITYEFVDALWANTSDASVIAKQSLVSKSAKVKAFTFPSTTAANPEVFDVPASWTVTTVEVLNTLSNQWETATSQFDVSNTTHNDAAGNSVNYKRYTCNLGMALGSRQVRVKWS